MALLRDNLEDMHKVVAYLLEKETITGGEMVAIIEGRDPTQVEDAYASTRAVPQSDEPPARKIHIFDGSQDAGETQEQESFPQGSDPGWPEPGKDDDEL